jgi:hypothetical protein
LKLLVVVLRTKEQISESMENALKDASAILIERFSFLDKEISKYQAEKKQIGQALKAVNPAAYEELIKSSAADAPKIKHRSLIKSSEKEKFSKLKTAGDKIVFVVNYFGRAVKAKMIEKLILDFEGPAIGNKTINSLPQKLKYLVDDGRLILAKYSGSNKYGFYILPKWKSSNKSIGIQAGHAPLPDDFETLSLDSRSPKKIEWIESDK